MMMGGHLEQLQRSSEALEKPFFFEEKLLKEASLEAGLLQLTLTI